MKKDKVSQFIALIGGFLGALYMALNASGISAEWINPQRVDAWVNVLNTGIPVALTFYSNTVTEPVGLTITNTYCFSPHSCGRLRRLSCAPL